MTTLPMDVWGLVVRMVDDGDDLLALTHTCSALFHVARREARAGAALPGPTVCMGARRVLDACFYNVKYADLMDITLSRRAPDLNPRSYLWDVLHGAHTFSGQYNLRATGRQGPDMLQACGALAVTRSCAVVELEAWTRFPVAWHPWVEASVRLARAVHANAEKTSERIEFEKGFKLGYNRCDIPTLGVYFGQGVPMSPAIEFFGRVAREVVRGPLCVVGVAPGRFAGRKWTWGVENKNTLL